MSRRRNKLDRSRWLLIEAEYKKKAGIDTGTYAVAYLTDEQLEELFNLLSKTAIKFINKYGEDENVNK